MGRVKVQPVYVPFNPSGVRIGQRIAAKANQTFYDKVRTLSNYGLDRELRKYLFDNYLAEVVKVDHELMIRFSSEEQKLIYILKEGA